jgi:gamma-glutamyl:cysteine ligase YbdK (ATP-grasp superfamily)
MSRLAAPASGLEHRFGAGPPLTVGVEEEYMLIDPGSLDLAQQSEDILRSEARGDFAELVSAELFESLVEFHRRCARASRSIASCDVAAVVGDIAELTRSGLGDP